MTTRLRILFVALFALMLNVATGAPIQVQAPTRVSVGDQFRISYVVNTTDVRGFRLQGVPDAFNVLIGPTTSTQQSYSYVNGHGTHTESVTYTYVLMAQKNGTFVIPSATCTIGGSAVKSSAIKITVVGNGSGAQQGNGGAQSRQPQRVDRVGTPVSGKDLFIRVTANKQHVYEQEPILLTYKVYTQVELTQLEGKMPDLNGFHTQEIPLPQQKTFHQESINGKSYNCVTWSQYVMFPQMSGKLEIPQLAFNGIVMQQNPDVDPFEAFFNGGSGYTEVKKVIMAPGVQIQVDPLPAKPANFSGGVGKFDIKASLDKNTVKAGDPVTLRFTISGNGNLKLIKQPEVELPTDFDKYDPKVTDNTKLTQDGLTGSMVFDVLVVPRNKGKFTIPATEFVYFDTSSASYKTITTEALELTVEEGNGNGATKSDYTNHNANDISDIIQGKAETQDVNNTFFGSITYMMVIASVLLIFIVLLVIFRKRALAMADTASMRIKKANKVAVKRLKKAAKLLSAGKKNDFYDEVLRALWGYVGDKLHIDVAELSRENISQKLTDGGVDEDTLATFIDAIDDCEFARYAPGDPADTMQRTYEKATQAITKIEKSL